MKKLFSFLVVVLLFSSESYTQWNKQDFNNSTVIVSVDFSGNNAVLSGALYDSVTNNAYPRVWHSTDGGLSWPASQMMDTMGYMREIQFINNTLVYGCGNKKLSGQYSGIFFQSTNGGQLWTEKGTLPASIEFLRDLHFISAQIGFAVAGEDSSDGVIKTTDGGLTWFWSFLPSDGFRFNKVSFYNSLNGFAAGVTTQNDGIVIKTTDGGLTWSSTLIMDVMYMTDLKYISSDKIVYSTFSKVFLSQDSGVTWSEILSIPVPSYIHGINGLPGDLIVVYGLWYGNFEHFPFVYASFNNGQSWVQSVLDPMGEFLFVDSELRSVSEWYLAGRGSNSGFIMKTTNSGGLPVELISFTTYPSEKSVKLEWITSSEVNNRGFEIERKLSYEEWQTAGFVNGTGTTTLRNTYTFIDDFSERQYEGTILYRLKQYDFDGTYEYSKIVSAEVNFIPGEISLFQNYPNPFNPLTNITFTLPFSSYAKLTIYNQLGQEIAVLADKQYSSGIYNVQWDASSKSSGVYYYTLEVTDNQGIRTIHTKKLIVIK